VQSDRALFELYFRSLPGAGGQLARHLCVEARDAANVPEVRVCA
jgi:hypothetical protein